MKLIFPIAVKRQHIWSQLLVSIIAIMAIPHTYASNSANQNLLSIAQVEQLNLLEQLFDLKQIYKQEINLTEQEQRQFQQSEQPLFALSENTFSYPISCSPIRAGPHVA